MAILSSHTQGFFQHAGVMTVSKVKCIATVVVLLSAPLFTGCSIAEVALRNADMISTFATATTAIKDSGSQSKPSGAAAMKNAGGQSKPSEDQPDPLSIPLCSAAERGDREQVEALLVKEGAAVNGRCRGGRTALHEAVYKRTKYRTERNLDVVKLLLAHGANTNIKDNYGNLPIDLASDTDSEILELLSQHASRSDPLQADRPLPRVSPDLRDGYKPIVAKAEDTVSTGSSAGDAVRALFADNTSTSTTSSSKSGWMYTRSDNTTLGRLSNGEMDEGTWRISQEGWFCRTWKNWADGKEGCWQVGEKNEYVKLTPKAGVADPYVIEILQGHDALQYRRRH